MLIIENIMISANGGDSSSVHSDLSASSRRIMKVRTLNESLRPKTDDEIEALRIRRRLRMSSSTTGLENSLSVSFNTVKVREYPIILGDNPSVSEGPPLSIDWHYEDVDEFEVEEYESTRPPRRVTNEMNIPAGIRSKILMRCGFGLKEIAETVKKVQNAKRNRIETNTLLYRSNSDERFENAKRGIFNIFLSC